MERIVGEPISSALWASEAFEGSSGWARAVTVVKECLSVDDWTIYEDESRLTWIADSLTVHFEIIATTPLPQFKLTIEVLNGFSDDLDGLFLASNLNKGAIGGSFVYESHQQSLNFVLYCAVSSWFDFALLIHLAVIAIGHCENLSRREDTLRYAKCKSAAQPHPSHGVRTTSHPLLRDRLHDMRQVDFIAGIWLSERERDGVYERIRDECTWVNPQLGWDDEAELRTIEMMDFGYQIDVPPEHSPVFRGNSAFTATEFNAWTDCGRAIVMHTALPFFTCEGIFDDGASHEDAVRLANALNRASQSMCWQKLGAGKWFAKGSQICHVTVIPHSILKPTILGANRFEIADLIFDLVNPNMIRRLADIAARDLHGLGAVSLREPQNMDTISSLMRIGQRISPTRASSEVLQLSDAAKSLWDFPSSPVLIFGIFNPMGPTLGSIELVHTLDSTVIVLRHRHLTSPDDEVLAQVPHNSSDLFPTISRAIGQLSTFTDAPDFISVPADLESDLRVAAIDGLFTMCKGLAEDGVDLNLKARRIHDQPNPWWRDPNTSPSTDHPDLEGLQPAEAFLSMAMHPELVDFNLGLFQAWWEGALAFLRDPNSPGHASQVVESFTEHTLDRIRGSREDLGG